MQEVVGIISLPDPRYPKFDIQTADVSGNSQITGYDAALVLQRSVGLISCFPIDPSCQAAPSSLAGSYSLRIPTLAAKLGEKVTVPLIISNDANLSRESGQNVPLSGQFVLEYDVESLKFLRVFSEQLHRNAVVMYRRNGEQLHIAFANPKSFSRLSDNDVDKGITILSFEFELKNNIYSQPIVPLTLSQASLNEDVIPTLYSGGIEMVPIKTVVLPNYPNPFNPETWIPYQLAEDAGVSIKIYNQNGQLVRFIVIGKQPTGFYFTKDRAAYWDGKNNDFEKVASGIYFYTLQAGDFKAMRKMVIVK